MAISLGKAARDLRSRLHLSLRDAASELGVSYVHLCNIENGKASPSPEMIEKFHSTWGVDLYMYAVAFHSDNRAIPAQLKPAVAALAEGWRVHIEEILNERRLEGENSCLISAD